MTPFSEMILLRSGPIRSLIFVIDAGVSGEFAGRRHKGSAIGFALCRCILQWAARRQRSAPSVGARPAESDPGAGSNLIPTWWIHQTRIASIPQGWRMLATLKRDQPGGRFTGGENGGSVTGRMLDRNILSDTDQAFDFTSSILEASTEFRNPDFPRRVPHDGTTLSQPQCAR